MYIFIFICINTGHKSGKVRQDPSYAFQYIISLINNGNIQNEALIQATFMIMFRNLDATMIDATLDKSQKKTKDFYATIIMEYMDITIEICTALYEKLNSTNKKLLHFNRFITNKTGPEYTRSKELIKHIIDSGYYMSISSVSPKKIDIEIATMSLEDASHHSTKDPEDAIFEVSTYKSNHTMVVINYENSGDDIILFIKNSYGYSDDIYKRMKLPMDKGIIKIPLKKAIELRFVDLEYLLIFDNGQDIGDHVFLDYEIFDESGKAAMKSKKGRKSKKDKKGRKSKKIKIKR